MRNSSFSSRNSHMSNHNCLRSELQFKFLLLNTFFPAQLLVYHWFLSQAPLQWCTPEISFFLNTHIPRTWIISQQDKPNPHSSAWKRSTFRGHNGREAATNSNLQYIVYVLPYIFLLQATHWHAKIWLFSVI